MLALPKKVSGSGNRTRHSWCLLALTTSCMRTVQMSNPALKPFASMYSVDRAQYGFTPLPKSGPVSIERKSTHGGYDAMLTSRTKHRGRLRSDIEAAPLGQWEEPLDVVVN